MELGREQDRGRDQEEEGQTHNSICVVQECNSKIIIEAHQWEACPECQTQIKTTEAWEDRDKHSTPSNPLCNSSNNSSSNREWSPPKITSNKTIISLPATSTNTLQDLVPHPTSPLDNHKVTTRNPE